jgi:hypothetical protein
MLSRDVPLLFVQSLSVSELLEASRLNRIVMLRFHIPLTELDRRSSCIRLSERMLAVSPMEDCGAVSRKHVGFLHCNEDVE